MVTDVIVISVMVSSEWNWELMLEILNFRAEEFVCGQPARDTALFFGLSGCDIANLVAFLPSSHPSSSTP